MAKYMIHTMPKRLWYVQDYLIPSMIEQGISKEDISVYNDEKHEGNLMACMRAFAQVEDNDGGTWHLQDDVIISSKFREVTEQKHEKITCGFCSDYDNVLCVGEVPVQFMWFSFPCIYIPNHIAIECSEWTLKYMINNPVYREYWHKGVNDDWMFRQYVWTYYRNDNAINLVPNIVDHVDYLIGGTVNSNLRGKQVRSKYWKEEDIVTELEKKLIG